MSRLEPARFSPIRVVAWPVLQLRRGILQRLTTLEIVLGGFGLVAALFTAALLSPALGALPGAAGDFAPIGMAILLAPVGIGVALGRRAEVERVLNSLRERTDSVADVVAGGTRPRRQPREVVVDTSAIIDGRLDDVAEAGFLLADLIIPRFVLDELRRVADSSDPLRRQRGRRGLEMLSRLQANGTVPTTIDETDVPGADVDAKLVRLASERSAGLLLTDSNLERVAKLEGIRTLNLNQLAQVLRVAVLPGERLSLAITQAGRERAQGVGYLDDGTMVVVEDGRDRVGDKLEVEVSRVIQTAAGRMLFATIAREDEGLQPARPGGTEP